MLAEIAVLCGDWSALTSSQCCPNCAGCRRCPRLQKGIGLCIWNALCISKIPWPIHICATGDRHVMKRLGNGCLFNNLHSWTGLNYACHSFVLFTESQGKLSSWSSAGSPQIERNNKNHIIKLQFIVPGFKLYIPLREDCTSWGLWHTGLTCFILKGDGVKCSFYCIFKDHHQSLKSFSLF